MIPSEALKGFHIHYKHAVPDLLNEIPWALVFSRIAALEKNLIISYSFLQKVIKYDFVTSSNGESALGTTPYLSVLLIMWIVSEAYLQWINYKGRFRYGLLEGNKWQRSLQNRIGVLSLAVSVLFKFGLILLLPALVVAIFKLSIDVASISVVSIFLGLTLTNASFDKFSVEAFEKHCKRCNHKRECNGFLDKNCTMEFVKHRVKMAVKLDDEANPI